MDASRSNRLRIYIDEMIEEGGCIKEGAQTKKLPAIGSWKVGRR